MRSLTQLSFLHGQMEQALSDKGTVISEFLPTPAPLTHALSLRVAIPQVLLEPCAGEGAIASVLKSEGHIVYESEILRPIAGLPVDATTPEFWEYYGQSRLGIRGVVTNPPFSLASQILPYALGAFGWAAFLLRLTYQEPCEDRSRWLVEHADHLRCQIAFNPRPRFRRDKSGGDSVTCAWYVWDLGFSWKSLGIDPPFQYCFF